MTAYDSHAYTRPVGFAQTFFLVSPATLLVRAASSSPIDVELPFSRRGLWELLAARHGAMSDGVKHASNSEGGALRSNALGSYRERNADSAASRCRQTRRSLDSLEQPSNTTTAWMQSHTRSDRRSSLDLDRPRLHRHHSPARADALRLRSSPGGSTHHLPSINSGPLAAMYSSFSGPNTGSEPQGAEAAFRHMHPPNLEDAVKRFVRPTPPAHGGITPTPHDQGGLHSLRYHSMHS
eukprot:jgi/Tetstr1/441524/TSEL_029754.t1